MKAFKLLKIFDAPKHHIDQLAGMLNSEPKYLLYPDGNTGWLEIDIEESDSDCRTFEHFCQEHGISFSSFRRRVYSVAETEAAEFFELDDTPIASDTSATKLTDQYACPRCGVGLKQAGPLTLKLAGHRRRKMFCVSLPHSNEWLVAQSVSSLFKTFSGHRLGVVCFQPRAKKPREVLQQVIVESHLPRMATITNFSEYDPPMKSKCRCNRAGWNLRDEIIYTRAALSNAQDFNLTAERWYGGGLAGLNGLIVSQRVRRVILDNKLLSPGCFDPVRVIEQDPGGQYMFDLPLDAPVSGKEL